MCHHGIYSTCLRPVVACEARDTPSHLHEQGLFNTPESERRRGHCMPVKEVISHLLLRFLWGPNELVPQSLWHSIWLLSPHCAVYCNCYKATDVKFGCFLPLSSILTCVEGKKDQEVLGSAGFTMPKREEGEISTWKLFTSRGLGFP